MSLDLAKIVTQVVDMVSRLKAGNRERQERLEHALTILSGQVDNIERLKEKISADDIGVRMFTRDITVIIDALDDFERLHEAKAKEVKSE